MGRTRKTFRDLKVKSLRRTFQRNTREQEEIECLTRAIMLLSLFPPQLVVLVISVFLLTF